MVLSALGHRVNVNVALALTASSVPDSAGDVLRLHLQRLATMIKLRSCGKLVASNSKKIHGEGEGEDLRSLSREAVQHETLPMSVNAVAKHGIRWKSR